MEYRFAPGEEGDGVTVRVPVSILNRLDPAPFSWQVPGLRDELATELIRTLPKAVRRRLVPAPDYAGRALRWLAEHPAAGSESFPAALGRSLGALTGDQVGAGDFDLEGLPGHLRVRFEVGSDTTGPSVVARGYDVDALKTELAVQVSRTLNAAAREHTRSGITRWDFGPLADTLTVSREGHDVVGYPALVDEVASVALTVTDTRDRQQRIHAAGLRRLVLLNTPDPTRWVVGHLSNTDKLALGHSPYASVPALLADARLAGVGELVRRHDGARVRDADAFVRLCDAVRADNAELMRTITGLAATIVTRRRAVVGAEPAVARRSPAAAQDLTEQLANLVFDGFLAATPYEHLAELPRYLQAAEVRIGALLSQPARDRAGLETVLRAEDAYAELCAAAPAGPLPDEIAAVGWLLEELRVSLFAQGLRTKVPVSEKRVRTAIAQARAGLG